MNMSSSQLHLEPSPATTIGILLGTSWPRAKQNVSPAFTRSAEKVRAYFCQADQFGLPPENWLDLFDAPYQSPLAAEQALTSFLDERLTVLQQARTPVRDVLFYYIGYGLFADADHRYHLALSCTREDSLASSSFSLFTLAEILKTRASVQRRIVLLDCYFPPESSQSLQETPDLVAIQQIYHAFGTRGQGTETLPQTGTALFCAFEIPSSQTWGSHESRLTFSEAMIHTLTVAPKSPDQQTRLSLSELHQRTTATLGQLTPGHTLQCFLGDPDQSSGKITDVPLFPYVAVHQTGSNGHPAAILPNKAWLFAEMQRYERPMPPPVISSGQPQLVSFVVKNNTSALLAIMSLILGIISLPMDFAFGPGFPLSGLGGVTAILGVILSRLGWRSIAHRKMATAGLILSLVALCLAVVLIYNLMQSAAAIHNMNQ